MSVRKKEMLLNAVIIHTVVSFLSQVPVPDDGPVGRDAAHCGAALWVGDPWF